MNYDIENLKYYFRKTFLNFKGSLSFFINE